MDRSGDQQSQTGKPTIESSHNRPVRGADCRARLWNRRSWWSKRNLVRRHESSFPEPTHPRPLPGGEQAFVRVLSGPLLGGVRGGFMILMHAQKRMEVPQGKQDHT